jgi:hypothetical protein
LTVVARTIESATRNGTGGFSKVIDTGDVITLSITMSEAVTSVTASGTGALPTLRVRIGSDTEQASYHGIDPNDSTKLLFKFTVNDANFDHDGILFAANSLSMNGGNIMAGSKAVSITASSSVLSAAGTANSDYRVDAIEYGDHLLIRGTLFKDDWYFVLDERQGTTSPNGSIGTEDKMSLNVARDLELTNGTYSIPDGSGLTLDSVLLPVMPDGTTIPFLPQPNTNTDLEGLLGLWASTASTQLGGANIPGWKTDAAFDGYWSPSTDIPQGSVELGVPSQPLDTFGRIYDFDTNRFAAFIVI